MNIDRTWAVCAAIFVTAGAMLLRWDIRVADARLHDHEVALRERAMAQESIWSQSIGNDRIVVPDHYSVVAEVLPDGRQVFWKQRRYCDLMPGGSIRVAPFDMNEDLRLYEYFAPNGARDGCADGIQFRLHNHTVNNWIRGYRRILEIDHAVRATQRGA